MANKTKSVLLAEAVVIRDETVPDANSATRVGQHLYDQTDSVHDYKTWNVDFTNGLDANSGEENDPVKTFQHAIDLRDADGASFGIIKLSKGTETGVTIPTSVKPTKVIGEGSDNTLITATVTDRNLLQFENCHVTMTPIQTSTNTLTVEVHNGTATVNSSTINDPTNASLKIKKNSSLNLSASFNGTLYIQWNSYLAISGGITIYNLRNLTSSEVEILSGTNTITTFILDRAKLIIPSGVTLNIGAFTDSGATFEIDGATINVTGSRTSNTGEFASTPSGNTNFGAESIKTLSTGVIASGTDRNLVVAAESTTTDDLIEVTGLSIGDKVLLTADTGDTITVKHNDAGATIKILIQDDDDFILDQNHPLELILMTATSLVQVYNDVDTINYKSWDVNVNNSPTGNGSSISPFLTAQEAIDVSSNGDIIYLAAGEYDEGELIIPASLQISIIGISSISDENYGSLLYGVELGASSELFLKNVEILTGDINTNGTAARLHLENVAGDIATGSIFSGTMEFKNYKGNIVGLTTPSFEAIGCEILSGQINTSNNQLYHYTECAANLDTTSNGFVQLNNSIVTGDITTVGATGDLFLNNSVASGTNSLSQSEITDNQDGGGTPEGTAVKSTGESGGVKFLREDGDNTCSWQVPAGSGDVIGPGSAVDENITVFDSTTGKIIKDGGVNISAVTENTTHKSSDGTDHSNVVLNDTHRASDGKNHSDVVLNNTHRSSDGTDHANVVLNDTHRSSDGTDHSEVVQNTSDISDMQIEATVIAVSQVLAFTGPSGTMTTDIARDITSISGIAARNSALFSLVGTSTITFENCTGFVDQGTFTKVNGQYDLVIFNVSETGTPAYRIADFNREPGGGTVDTSGTPVVNDFARFTDVDTIEGRSYTEVKTDLGLVIGTNVLAEQTIGIANDNLLEVDGTPNSAEYARFTANGIEGRTEAEFKADFNLEIGTDVLAQQTIGIADNNLVEIDSATVANTEYAKFTANGLESKTFAEVKTDLSLNNVENTALSTGQAGTVATITGLAPDTATTQATQGSITSIANLATIGTVTSGTISTGAVIADVTMTLGSDADGDIYYRSGGKLTRIAKGTARQVLRMNSGATAPEYVSVVVPVSIAASDETTALTTGTAKATFRVPFAMTLTDIRASVTTAPTDSVLTVDVNEGGTTILSTKITIDATEKTSTTAAIPPVISDSSLADDAEMTVDIDTIGSTIAGAGLKVYLIGYLT